MMAQTITCDICNSEAASVLQTDIATGEVLAVGQACHFPFYVGVAGAIAESMPAEIRAEYAEAVGKLAAAFGVIVAAPVVPDDAPAEPSPADPDGQADGVTGEAIPVTGDGVPQLAGGDSDGGQETADGLARARRARAGGRARSPR